MNSISIPTQAKQNKLVSRKVVNLDYIIGINSKILFTSINIIIILLVRPKANQNGCDVKRMEIGHRFKGWRLEEIINLCRDMNHDSKIMGHFRVHNKIIHSFYNLMFMIVVLV